MLYVILASQVFIAWSFIVVFLYLISFEHTPDPILPQAFSRWSEVHGYWGKGGSWASSQGDTFQNPQLSRDPQQSKSEINGGIPKALKENFHPGKFFYLFQKNSPSVKIFQWGIYNSSHRRSLSRSCGTHHDSPTTSSCEWESSGKCHRTAKQPSTRPSCYVGGVMYNCWSRWRSLYSFAQAYLQYFGFLPALLEQSWVSM